MELRHEVAVTVERGLNRGMAQLRLDVLRVGAVGDQQAGVGVAKVVKSDAAQLGPPERRRELPVPEVVRIERRAPFTAEDKPRAPGGRELLQACSSVGGISIARRERLDLGVPSVPCQSDRRT